MTSEATRNATSLPAAASGPSQPEWPDGQTTDLFGPVAAPASRSARQAKVEEPMIQGICGRTFIASSVPAGPLSSWESRLRERLGMVGSTESALIWREKTTPAGASISRLAPSTRHTNGTGSIGSPWRSPTAGDNRGGAYADPAKAIARMDSGHTINLEDQMVANWSTPRASDGEKGGPNMSFGAGGQPLPAQMHQAKWPTVQAALSYPEDPTKHTARYQRHQETEGSWGMGQNLPTLMGAGTALTGPTPTGSSATTAKRGAPNPVFAMWLMGFPEEVIRGILEALAARKRR
jgi:hypothetical protein